MSPTRTTGVDAPETIPLSLNHQFVDVFDHGSDDGPFGPRYHVVDAWRVTGGPIDVAALREALQDVVKRHESLRTRIVGTAGNRHQEISPPGPVSVEIRDLSETPEAAREDRADALRGEVENETIGADETPALRVVLGRFDDQDTVLVLMIHHIVSDGMSIEVVIRDLANRYAARTGHTVPDLPAAPQFREFADWQRTGGGAGTEAKREYWRRKLDGGLFSALPTDIPRSANLPESTAAHWFVIPDEVFSNIDRLARTYRATRFMTLVAMYKLLVHRLTGATDVVIATFTPGRGGQLFENTVGPLFNFLPLRTDLAGCGSFEDLLKRTRTTCLEAFSHEMPTLEIFGQAPELMRTAASDNAAAAVFQAVPDQQQYVAAPGELKYGRIPRMTGLQPRKSAVPDGALWTLTRGPSGDASVSLSFKRNLFHEETIASMAANFEEIARTFSSSPDAPLRLS
ncbi:condensation domain-containing protein [Micromonospora schwarzwaldensis]|uniref:condensation domain-containing protein n=1 Tax=Micromonospora sp. DSM 45708 TaxID=3111767 RepID=UPI0031D21A67